MIGVDVVDMEVGGLGAGLARRGLGRLAASLKAGPCALRADTLAPFGWSFALAHTVSTDDPLHARVARGLEHAQRPVTRRSDQFLIIFRVSHWHRRGDMQDILCANGRLTSARV